MKDITVYPVMNPVFEVTEVESDERSATVMIEPLEQGYGHTIGNALRRVLLSSLPGSAITRVKINGVDHQYTTLDGMTEDVVELILNLKQVRVKSTGSDDEAKLTLNVKGPAEVTAADLEVGAGLEVINKDQFLATVGKGSALKLEAIVEQGVGYEVAQDRKAETLGEIPVDALFSPVTKVAYTVEQTRVGRRTDYDKIVMEIMTDGTISAGDAVRMSATILQRQFQQIVEPVLPVPVEKAPELTPEEAEVLRLTVEELDLPTRIANALRKGGFKTVADLKGAPRATITKVKNLGEKSVEIIDEALEKKGVGLAGNDN